MAGVVQVTSFVLEDGAEVMPMERCDMVGTLEYDVENPTAEHTKEEVRVILGRIIAASKVLQVYVSANTFISVTGEMRPVAYLDTSKHMPAIAHAATRQVA